MSPIDTGDPDDRYAIYKRPQGDETAEWEFVNMVKGFMPAVEAVARIANEDEDHDYYLRYEDLH